MGKKIILISCFLSILVFINGCVSSSNFHTAKTLEENKFAITVGCDDIILKSENKSVTVSKDGPFAPSFGLAYGLPLRLEAGLRYFPSRMFELSLRDQINPRDFKDFDCSVNLNFGHLVNGYSYLKYGLSLSKDISDFEPYLHYTFYSYLGANNDDFSDSFFSGAVTGFIDNCRVLGFGIGIPLKKIKIFPEADYQHSSDNFSSGLWHFGIGIRVYTN